MDKQNDQTPPLRSLYRIKSPHGWEVETTSIEGHALALEWFNRLAELPLPIIAPLPPPAFTAENPIAISQSGMPDCPMSEGQRFLISQWVEDYMEYLPTSSKLNDKGRTEAHASLKLFVAIVGDKPLGGLTTRDGQTFVSTLLRWPAHASKKPEFRDITSPKEMLRVAKELKAPVISPVTVLNRVGYVQGFFTWLQRRQEIKFDPFYGVVLPDPVQQMIRHPFTPEEIQLIFDHEKRLWADTPHDFWAPLLAFYTGARVREVGQLYVDDVETIQGVHVVHISERFPGQQVKTDGSERVIPLRTELVELGFLDYVRDIKLMGSKLLFPGTTWTNGDAGRPISRPFNETYLREVCGITERNRSFHSFRHLFSNQAERSGLTDGRISQLTGHKLENISALRTNYIQAATLPQRHADIHLIDLPLIDVEKYRTGQFDRYFRDSKRRGHRAKLKVSEQDESNQKPDKKAMG